MTAAEELSGLVMPSASEVQGLSLVMGYIVRRYQVSLGVVGEERNIARLFSTVETRHLPKPHRRHFLAQAEFGMGKSTLVRLVLKPIWGDVECYSRVSGPGLDRREESFDGKILFVEQLRPDEPMQLAFLMTEGELTILVSERDPESKRFISTRHSLKGMPNVVSTLTGAMIDPQLMSRFDIGRIDESAEQTDRINNHRLHEAAYPRFENLEFLYGPITWIDRQCRELGPRVRQVCLPFAEKLSIPKGFKSMRRKLPQILALVQGIAFIKASLGLRPLVEVRIVESDNVAPDCYVVAYPEDLADAVYCLGEKELEESVEYFYGRCREVYDYLISNPNVTSATVMRDLRMGRKTAQDYLRTLCDLGHATRTKIKGEFQYVALPLDNVHKLGLKVQFNDHELLEWYSRAFPNGGKSRLLLPGRDLISKVAFSSVSVEPADDAILQTASKFDAERRSAPDPSLDPSDENATVHKPADEVVKCEYCKRRMSRKEYQAHSCPIGDPTHGNNLGEWA